MNILITNDDGFESVASKLLAKQLSKKHKVMLVLPKHQMSACSHSLTIRKTLKVERMDFDGIEAWQVYGSTADCVKFACTNLLHFHPDLVLSGINDGTNVGTDVIYSGTVAGAREGAILGYPSIALSRKMACNLNDAIEFVKKNVESFAKLSHHDVFYNINFPKGSKQEWKKVVPCFFGKNYFSDVYHCVEGGYYLDGEEDYSRPNQEKTDVEYLKEGCITITPVEIYSRSEQLIDELNKYFSEN